MNGNNKRESPPRRTFMKVCMTAVAAAGAQRVASAIPHGPHRKYQRVQLMRPNNKPLRASELVTGENYIFHYPFVTTPCFLLELGEPAARNVELRTEQGEAYLWQGGVGNSRSIVAFSAICAHKMTHPAKSVSFINYRHERVKYADKSKQPKENNKVIFCCSEKSVYDVRNGAQVLGGPAKQPLAAVTLEHEPDSDALFATGTFGGEMFDKFFTTFRNRLQLEYRISEVDAQITQKSLVLPLDEYCQTQILC